MNAIKLLMQDHKKVRQLLTELEGTTTRNVRDRQRLVQEISNEVNIHAKIEEEIFYPAFKEAAKKTEDTDMFFEAAEEHHVVEMVLPELEAADPASDEFRKRATIRRFTGAARASARAAAPRPPSGGHRARTARRRSRARGTCRCPRRRGTSARSRACPPA